jgi:hypothetical protein
VSDDPFSFTRVVFFVGAAVVFLLAAASGSCSDASEARRVLSASGFTDIDAGGYAWFECGDTFATKFTAKNHLGQTVSGAVCCGWLKSCTVRF